MSTVTTSVHSGTRQGSPPHQNRVEVLLDQIAEHLAEVRLLRAMEATGQDLTLSGAAAIISSLADRHGVDLDAQEIARAWLRAWESLPA